MPKVWQFIEAIVASMIGHYVCRMTDDVVTLIIDWLK